MLNIDDSAPRIRWARYGVRFVVGGSRSFPHRWRQRIDAAVRHFVAHPDGNMAVE